MVLEDWKKWRSGVRRGRDRGAIVLGPLWMLGYSSVVVGEDACVRDCRQMGCVELA
jgi:hypothetical protein